MDPLEEAKTAATRWREAQSALEKAKEERDNAIRQAHEGGCAQRDLADATELTRETIRRITNPEAAEAVRAAQRATKGT